MNPHQPPYGQQGNYGQYPPQGPPAPGPPPGQAGQGYYGYQQPPGGQYQAQPYPGGPPPGQGQYQYPPAGGGPPQQYHGQSAPGYGAPPPGQAPYGQQQYGAPYGQQPPYQQQPYGVPPPGQQWQQPQPGYGAPPGQQPYAQPTPPSLGYDVAQKQYVQHVDTSADAETVRKAMKGMGCDERALIRVLADRKYQNPWTMAQLVHDYNSRFGRDLAQDIKGETRGDFETGLMALLRGPLNHDVYTLDKALDRAGTDEEALMDVLLCRSNADIRAISAAYKRAKGHDLIVDIKDDVNEDLGRFYGMVLAASRAEDSHPVIPTEIDQKITELQRATEGTIGANTVAVAQIFTSVNDAQMRAMSEAYHRKYHRSLRDVIEKEFRGDMEDVLLRILSHGAATDKGKQDVDELKDPLLRAIQKDRVFIYRALRLYWSDRRRLEEAQAACRRVYGRTLTKQLKELLSGDYEDLMLALIGEK